MSKETKKLIKYLKEQIEDVKEECYDEKDLGGSLEEAKYIGRVRCLQAINAEFPHLFRDTTSDKEPLLYNDIIPKTHITAYTDGSFNQETKMYGMGVVFINEKNEIIAEISKGDNKEQFISSQQIGGEVEATILAIQWAKKHNIPNIKICYDYMGIEMWAKQKWKTNKPVSIDYVEKITLLEPFVNLEFEKVKAHSKNKFNDRADELAKEGCQVI